MLSKITKKGLDCLLQKLSHREQGFPENQLKNIKNWKKSKALFDQTEKNHNNYNNYNYNYNYHCFYSHKYHCYCY